MCIKARARSLGNGEERAWLSLLLSLLSWVLASTLGPPRVLMPRSRGCLEVY